MSIRLVASGVLAVALAGCAGEKWPEPPPVDQAQYQKNYQTWLDEQQETARASTKEVGIWPLQEGETPFGSDASLPIVASSPNGSESSWCLSSCRGDGHCHACAGRRARGRRRRAL